RALEALVAHAAREGSGGHSPSDFALLDLAQGEIEELERGQPRLEDVLPLSPLQEGLLFHALYDAHAPDVYTVQLELELEGGLDVAALEAAVQAVVARHASLRACFRHERLDRPVQVIVAGALAPWRLIDLSMHEEGERGRRLSELVAADRLTRFDLSAAPLLRFALVRLEAERHRLLLSSHHLLMDGWSAPVVVRELLELYRRRGDSAALPRLTPYRDYLAFVAGQDRPASLAYWREALSGLEEATRIAPADAGRAAVAPETLELALEEQLSGGLLATARAAGVTLNSLLQAAWGVLLGRLTGRDDVVFGVTVAGRPAELAGVESMVGLFINTLPLRLAVSPGEPLAELLRQTQERQSQLMAHQYVGLAEVQQAAGLGELFDTLMVFENYPVDRAGLAAAAGGLRLGAVRGHDATHYPLSLMVRPGERLSLRLDYRPDLFDRGSVEALGQRLLRLLSGAVAAPDRAIGSLAILSERERATVLEHWNATARPVAPATLPELFAAQAARTPDAVALVYQDRRLSYAELEAHANRLAHHLRGLGVGPETVVGLCLERSPELVIGLLGILKAGGAYLPLDPGYPAPRLSYMLSDAGAAVLVTQSALLPRLAAAALPARLVRLDADWAELARRPAQPPTTSLDPAHPAYVIYTSGSTGTPKGVIVTHQNVVRLFEATKQYFHFGSDDTWTLFHSFAFDFSVWEIWG
ncbi:MAG TPA: condensation domain-containing protein, partial [Burkholderiaceae bacterium]|nr:condensation domain-containing protein [Burkholderiaceae bacterium]